jgi:predicted permease
LSLSFLQLALSLGAGLALQRHPARDRLVRLLWFVSFDVLGPLTAFYAFSVLPLERRTALLTLLVVATCWSSLAVGYVYGLLAGRSLSERAALALPIGFWNTGYVGYVAARLLWGQHGFALMVFFDQVGFLVPAIVISTAIARSHSGRDRPLAVSELLHRVVVNPPLAGGVAGLVLRLAGVHVPGLGPLGHWLGLTVGPYGFMLLGLAVPVAGAALAGGELPRALAALAVRYAAGPLLLVGWGAALGVAVPPVFFLAALTPAATHLLVLSRLFSLRPALMRLIVVGSTAATMTGVACASFLHV